MRALLFLLISLTGHATSDCGPAAETPAPAPQGKHYYIAQAGYDHGPCSKEAPCRELEAVTRLLLPGDTIHVGDGTYNGMRMVGVLGAPGRPIRIVAEGKRAEVRAYEMTSRAKESTLVLFHCRHLIVDGLNVRKTLGAGLSVIGGSFITIRNGHYETNRLGIFAEETDDLTLEDNVIKDSKEVGILVYGAKRPRLLRNRIYDVKGNGIHTKGGDSVVAGARIEGNIAARNEDSGMRLEGLQDSVVANNLLHDNQGNAIILTRGIAAGGPKNVKLINNTLVARSAARFPLEILRSEGSLFIRNNVLYHEKSSRAGINFGEANDLQNSDSDYNVLTVIGIDAQLTELPQWKKLGKRGEAHSLPFPGPKELFLGGEKAPYQLAKASPARGKGAPVADVPRDFEGKCRRSPPSLGAYE